MEYHEAALCRRPGEPGECFYNIIGWLVSHGYSDTEISAVVGGNIVRVLEEVWV